MSLIANRELIVALTKREILGRYRGSAIGMIWSIITPITMIAVYTFVFGSIFKARWGSNPAETRLDFALLLFAGLIAFNLFSECISKAPTIILSNANYVKKVVFPLETLPIVSLATALIHSITSLLAWLTIHLIFKGPPPIAALLSPLTLVPLCLTLLGASWFLAALGVYLRDTQQIIAPAITMIMFLSPIFYPSSLIPESTRWLFELNPLTEAIESFRNSLFWGNIPNIKTYFTHLAIGIFVAQVGFYFFQKTRQGFGDVI